MARDVVVTAKVLGAALAVVALSGCASSSKSGLGSSSERAESYSSEKTRLEKTQVIAPGFLLRVRQSADEQLSGEFRVSFKGTVKLPYDVTLQAAGVTTDALASKITKTYEKYFKVRNNVSVEIAQRTYSIEVRGLVSKPGTYNVKLDSSVEEIMALAGALGTGSPSGGAASAEGKVTQTQRPEYIRIVRPLFNEANPDASTVHWVRLSDYFLQYEQRADLLWRGGEQLFFQVVGDPQNPDRRGRTIQLLGAVQKPGEYAILARTDLLSYIAQAGGPTATADLEHVTVIKRRENDSESYNVTNEIHEVSLAPGDTVLVKNLDTKAPFLERIAPALVSAAGIVVTIILAVAL